MTPVTAVTLVTRDASLDTLSTQDYRDIYDELRGYDASTHTYPVSFDRMIALIGSAYSKALWARYHNGESQLNRTQRNELRRYVGLPPLPPTVAEATAAASPDAAVWHVGDGIPERVVMLAGEDAITIHVNGSVTVMQDCPVTTVTDGKVERSRIRRTFYRPCATEAQESRRSAIGAAWREVIEAGLATLEKQRK